MALQLDQGHVLLSIFLLLLFPFASIVRQQVLRLEQVASLYDGMLLTYVLVALI